MFKKLKLISETADVNVVKDVKEISIAEFKKIFPKLVNDLNSNIEKIDGLFCPENILIDDIQDMKKTLSEISASDDDHNMKLKKYGIIKNYSDLINAYIHQLELKKLFDKYKSDIVDLLESDNAFYNNSLSDFELLSDIDFDDFMKAEPKFNLSKCELWK
jgi:L-2-hydroxyglutarate oxidase LhgO